MHIGFYIFIESETLFKKPQWQQHWTDLKQQQNYDL